ncbi:MAG: fumarylacetoacetate hydrolase family protein [Chloroflexota bacterium]|nr:fumarylacetoacetate hydrolase family protein [Chloroflexota bacterium]PLS78168.1 MAG: 5-carboxymethyl-2-hydroxymuconate isomerase [Chloroflexota bacterium]
MRLISFAGRGIMVGALHNNEVVMLDSVADDMLSLIEMGPSGLKRARQVIAEGMPRDLLPLDQVKLLAPLPRLSKNIVCLGMNYVEHAYESMRAKGLPETLPEHPVFFTKATTTVNHPEGGIPLDSAITQQLDWEVELAFIIGQRGKNIKRADAMRYVWGYTIINDISARDLQNRHNQFFKGKSLDGSCPMGPCILTADEVPNPAELGLRLRVNGVTKQESVVGDLIFDIPTIIETLSQGQTLEPGDIIATGTPSGVGMGRTPQEWLQVGDVVEAEIDKIGVLRNTVVKA